MFKKAFDNLVLSQYRSHENINKSRERTLNYIRSYTIDPPGSTDADDGFSLWTEYSKGLQLAIHIADPTECFDPTSKIFKTILERGATHYPSGHSPRHMMEDWLVEKASLYTNNPCSEIKNAISVVTTIDKITWLPTGKAKIMLTKICCSASDHYTYNNVDIGEEIEQWLKNIAAAMKNQRNTVGKKLSDLN